MNADASDFLLALVRAFLLANGACSGFAGAETLGVRFRRPDAPARSMSGEKVDETFPARERLTVNANPTAGAARNRAHQENQ